MIVWVVVENNGDESWIRGVFDSQEKATAFMKAKEDPSPRYYMDAEVWELNDESG